MLSWQFSNYCMAGIIYINHVLEQLALVASVW